jgi:Porin subfamily
MMRSRFPIVIAVSLVVSPAMAESSSPPKIPKPTQPGKPLPMKGAPSANSCAAYGPGFVRLEGTDTCVQIGGAISIGAGGAIGGRH